MGFWRRAVTSITQEHNSLNPSGNTIPFFQPRKITPALANAVFLLDDILSVFLSFPPLSRIFFCMSSSSPLLPAVLPRQHELFLKACPSPPPEPCFSVVILHYISRFLSSTRVVVAAASDHTQPGSSVLRAASFVWAASSG